MAGLFKLILLFLFIMFIITVVRIALSVLKLLSTASAASSQNRSEDTVGRKKQNRADGSRTIELDKNDYKVE